MDSANSPRSPAGPRLVSTAFASAIAKSGDVRSAAYATDNRRSTPELTEEGTCVAVAAIAQEAAKTITAAAIGDNTGNGRIDIPAIESDVNLNRHRISSG